MSHLALKLLKLDTFTCNFHCINFCIRAHCSIDVKKKIDLNNFNKSFNFENITFTIFYLGHRYLSKKFNQQSTFFFLELFGGELSPTEIDANRVEIKKLEEIKEIFIHPFFEEYSRWCFKHLEFKDLFLLIEKSKNEELSLQEKLLSLELIKELTLYLKSYNELDQYSVPIFDDEQNEFAWNDENTIF